MAAFGPLGLVALKGAIVGGTWALARRYPAQLPRPVALIVTFCCLLVAGAVALDVAALDGWRGWLGRSRSALVNDRLRLHSARPILEGGRSSARRPADR